MKRVALITGGSRGIGLGIAQALAREGWNLMINGIRPEEQLVSVLEELRQAQSGVEVLYCSGNVGDSEDRARMIACTLERFGHLNALINNAGVAPRERKDLLEMSEESYDRVMTINLKGAFFLAQIAAKSMIAEKEQEANFPAYIINMSSISATVVSVNRGQYCISKAGMSMMSQLFAARLGEWNIPVYEVRPGVIATDMTSRVKTKYDKLFEEGLTVQKRWGNPEDVGKLVAALLRGDMPYATGQVLLVDGGLTIPRL